jgi:hypothetical protein
MFTARMLQTTYSGGRLRVTRFQIDRETRHEVELQIMEVIGAEIIGLYKPDSGERVAFDVVIRENHRALKGYMIGALLEEGIIDVLPEDDTETPHELPGSIVI